MSKKIYLLQLNGLRNAHIMRKFGEQHQIAIKSKRSGISHLGPRMIAEILNGIALSN